MSGLELNKIAGAILTTALVAMVIGIIGDALVYPRKHKSAEIVIAAKAPSLAPTEEEILPIGPMMASANLAAGKKVANKCKSCHDLTKAKKNKIGPPLWDVVMAGKGGTSGHKYSKAMGSMGGQWSYNDLNAFIASPKKFLKGTKMTFAGVRSAKDRANLILFLRSLSDAPKPLPE